MGNSNLDKGCTIIEATPLEVLRFVLESGGPNADVVANATDEEIQQLLDEIEAVRIIM